MTSRSDLLERIRDRAGFVRRQTVRLISIAKSGHYASVFSCAEILAALYYHILRYDASRPQWPERDRFVLSKGHAAVGLYPILADVGFFPKTLLDGYSRMGSAFGDHPEMRRIPGIDFGSGSLGHGLSVAAGMALAARLDGSDARAFCLMGDGEQDEGQIWEAALSAAHWRLGNLIGIIDRNGVSVDGDTEQVMQLEPLADKWRAFGWHVEDVDGHDVEQLVGALERVIAAGRDRPTVLIAQTVAGKGVSFMEGRYEWHIGYLGPDREREVMAELGGRMSDD